MPKASSRVVETREEIMKKNQLTSYFGVIALSFLVVACGGGHSGSASGGAKKTKRTEPPFHGSCNQPAASSCTEFIGTGWAVGGMPVYCGMAPADPNPCPRVAVLGRCNFLQAPMDADSRIYYYEGSIYNHDDIPMLKSTCQDTLHGVFEVL
jgi:hypothetical protein